MNNNNAAKQVVVFVAPPESVSILRSVLAGLPAQFPAALVILLHEGSGNERPVTVNLNTSSAIMVVPASDGMTLRSGRAHVVGAGQGLALGGDGCFVSANSSDADSDSYLLGEDHDLSLGRAEPMLESLAIRYHNQAIAVALTLLTEREASGFGRVREMGGHTIALDESDLLWTKPAGPRVAPSRGDELLSPSAMGPRMLQMLDGREGNQTDESHAYNRA